MRRGPLLLWVSLWATLPLVAGAQSLPELFSQSNAAYFEGNHTAAIEGYQKLVDAGVDDADVYYNLGTAYARAGQCGRAIHALERSLKISAGDGAAERNLHACQALLGKRRAQRDGEATVQTRPPWSEAVRRGVSLDTLAWLALALNMGLFGTLLVRRFVVRETVALGLALGAWLLGLTLVVAVLALGTKAEWFRDGSGAIVLVEEAPLREGPDPRARTRTHALEGEPARVLQREGDFLRVRLARGPEGWMSRDEVGTL